MSGWNSWGNSSSSSSGSGGSSSSWGGWSSPSKKKDSNGGWGSSWGSSDSSSKNNDSSSSSGWGWGSSSSSSSNKDEAFFKKGDLFKTIPGDCRDQFLKFDKKTQEVKNEAKTTRDTLNKIEGLPPISTAVCNYQQMMSNLLDRMDQYRRDLAPFYEEIKQQYALANEIQSDIARRSYGGSGDGRSRNNTLNNSGNGIMGGWLIGDTGGGLVSSGIELPPPYYWRLVGSFEDRITALRKCVAQLTEEMRDLEEMAGLSSSMMSMDISMMDPSSGKRLRQQHYHHSQSSSSVLSRQRSELDVLVSSMQSVFRATVNLARQVSSLHSETETLKAAYTEYRRERFGDTADHFAATRARRQAAAAADARRNSIAAAAAGGRQSTTVPGSSSFDHSSTTLGSMAGLPGYDALTEYEATQAQTLKLSGLQAVDVRVDPKLAGMVGDGSGKSSDDQKKDDSSGGSGSSSGDSGSSSGGWSAWGNSSSSDKKDSGFTFGGPSSSSSSSKSDFGSSSFSW